MNQAVRSANSPLSYWPVDNSSLLHANMVQDPRRETSADRVFLTAAGAEIDQQKCNAALFIASKGKPARLGWAEEPNCYLTRWQLRMCGAAQKIVVKDGGVLQYGKIPDSPNSLPSDTYARIPLLIGVGAYLYFRDHTGNVQMIFLRRGLKAPNDAQQLEGIAGGMDDSPQRSSFNELRQEIVLAGEKQGSSVLFAVVSEEHPQRWNEIEAQTIAAARQARRNLERNVAALKINNLDTLEVEVRPHERASRLAQWRTDLAFLESCVSVVPLQLKTTPYIPSHATPFTLNTFLDTTFIERSFNFHVQFDVECNGFEVRKLAHLDVPTGVRITSVFDGEYGRDAMILDRQKLLSTSYIIQSHTRNFCDWFWGKGTFR